MPAARGCTTTRGPRLRARRPVNPPTRKDDLDGYATQGDVLLHVYEELAQHLGQLEVTRDVLLSRQG